MRGLTGGIRLPPLLMTMMTTLWMRLGCWCWWDLVRLALLLLHQLMLTPVFCWIFSTWRLLAGWHYGDCYCRTDQLLSLLLLLSSDDERHCCQRLMNRVADAAVWASVQTNLSERICGRVYWTVNHHCCCYFLRQCLRHRLLLPLLSSPQPYPTDPAATISSEIGRYTRWLEPMPPHPICYESLAPVAITIYYYCIRRSN